MPSFAPGGAPEARDDLVFKGTGMNAVQVSCASREADAGLCGALRSEVRRIPGENHLCPVGSVDSNRFESTRNGLFFKNKRR